MIKHLTDYKTLIFDCDGVILNSNKIKTDCFYSSASSWSHDAARDLVAYHIANGGISRHVKFTYFLEKIVPFHFPDAVPGIDGPGLDHLLKTYASSVYGSLLNCDVAKRLDDLRFLTSKSSWCVVSGSDQSELRTIFAHHRLNHLFDAGIFGSPDAKPIILNREIQNGSIKFPALFLGDSKYDYYCSNKFNMDFLFLYGWSDVSDWFSFVSCLGIEYIEFLSELLE